MYMPRKILQYEYKLQGTDLVIYKALCFDVAQGRRNGAPNGTRTRSCRFACPACEPLHHQTYVIQENVEMNEKRWTFR